MTGRISLVKALLLIGSSWCLSAGLTGAAAQAPVPIATPVLVAPFAPSPANVQKSPDTTHSPATALGVTIDTARVAPPSASSAWRQLTPMQRQALAPLGAQWSALTAQQQNKWLAISKNFTQLAVADQITMHARMADWVDLSPQQRNLARLNFNQLQSLPKEDKKAKWEAYQALSTEEKRLLGAGSVSPTKSAAPAAKLLEPHRRVQTPLKTAGGSPAQPASIDRKTLLPRPPALTAPTPSLPSPAPAVMPEGAKPPSESAPS